MSYLVNPWLFVAGMLAIAFPVLIHLLSRRRLRVVDWAAIEFLLQAERRSRRRIRLQHWLLLLLRSLAVGLVGLLLARPFLPTRFSVGLIPIAPFERIIVLDDSLSMQARLGNESSWELARRRAIDLIRRLIDEGGGHDTATLLLTSQPNQPVIDRFALGKSLLSNVESRLEQLECGDGAASLAQALSAVEHSLEKQTVGINRLVYVFTDMCKNDWQKPDQGHGGVSEQAAEGAIDSLHNLAKRVQGCFVIDVGNENEGNLAVTQVQTDKAMVSGVRTPIDAIVRNFGTSAVNNIKVKLIVEDGLPTGQMIDRLSARESTTVRFYSTLLCEQESERDELVIRPPQPRKIRVELQPESAADDRLAADSVRYFPAPVICGIHALIVDGDPSPEFGKSESFYLTRALAPTGLVRSGIVTRVVTESEIDSLSFSDYDAIFLLNCDQLGGRSDENLQRLMCWVENGGGLVLMPGDQTEARRFNSQFWRDGHGLSPLQLDATVGDDRETDWVTLQPIASTSFLAQLAGEQSPLLEHVKIFRWWKGTISAQGDMNSATVIARFNNGEHSPAIVERPWGDGRVVVFAIPADTDWHDWPANPSYVLTMQDLMDSLTKDKGSGGLLRVGDAIRQPVDLTRYEPDATLTGPKTSTTHLQASPPGASTNSTIWKWTSPAIGHLGFHEMNLTRRGGGEDRLLFAANADAGEGDLSRMERAALEKEITDPKICFMSADGVELLTDTGARSELWWYLAWLLVAVLAGEQTLGWLFGRERA